MPKIHLNSEQFDNAMHPLCGRGKIAVYELEFEATPYKDRCKLCDREWFPNGQPDWHFNNAVETFRQEKEKSLLVSFAMLSSMKDQGLMKNTLKALKDVTT